MANGISEPIKKVFVQDIAGGGRRLRGDAIRRTATDKSVTLFGTYY